MTCGGGAIVCWIIFKNAEFLQKNSVLPWLWCVKLMPAIFQICINNKEGIK